MSEFIVNKFIFLIISILTYMSNKKTSNLLNNQVQIYFFAGFKYYY